MEIGNYNYPSKAFSSKKESSNFVETQKKNMSYFQGETKDSLRQGKGKIVWHNGSVFEGEFNNNKANGKITLITLKDMEGLFMMMAIILKEHSTKTPEWAMASSFQL